MQPRRVVISVNAAWNIHNFRRGLILELCEAGYSIVALAPEDGYGDRLTELGIEFLPIDMDNQGVSPLRDLILLGRYRAALKRIRPALFLGFTAKPNVYGSLAAHSLGIKVINNVSGLGTAFIRNGLLTRIVSNLYRVAFRRSATVFFQNEDDKAMFLAKRIVRHEQARLLPGSGIDPSYFAPRHERPEDGRFRFLMIGRLLRDKGVSEYVAAARQLRSIRPGACFQLLGFVDVANRTVVSRAELNEWMREGLIEYLPPTDDVRPHIAHADCIVLPSYREGLPRTLLEAAAMEKPIIATDVPGCREIVEHRVNGLLCAPENGHALAEAMIQMMSLDAEEHRRMGRRGRERVKRFFDQRVVVDHYLKAIGEALSPLD